MFCKFTTVTLCILFNKALLACTLGNPYSNPQEAPQEFPKGMLPNFINFENDFKSYFKPQKQYNSKSAGSTFSFLYKNEYEEEIPNSVDYKVNSASSEKYALSTEPIYFWTLKKNELSQNQQIESSLSGRFSFNEKDFEKNIEYQKRFEPTIIDEPSFSWNFHSLLNGVLSKINKLPEDIYEVVKVKALVEGTNVVARIESEKFIIRSVVSSHCLFKGAKLKNKQIFNSKGEKITNKQFNPTNNFEWELFVVKLAGSSLIIQCGVELTPLVLNVKNENLFNQKVEVAARWSKETVNSAMLVVVIAEHYKHFALPYTTIPPPTIPPPTSLPPTSLSPTSLSPTSLSPTSLSPTSLSSTVTPTDARTNKEVNVNNNNDDNNNNIIINKKDLVRAFVVGVSTMAAVAIAKGVNAFVTKNKEIKKLVLNSNSSINEPHDEYEGDYEIEYEDDYEDEFESEYENKNNDANRLGTINMKPNQQQTNGVNNLDKTINIITKQQPIVGHNEVSTNQESDNNDNTDNNNNNNVALIASIGAASGVVLISCGVFIAVIGRKFRHGSDGEHRNLNNLDSISNGSETVADVYCEPNPGGDEHLVYDNNMLHNN